MALFVCRVRISSHAAPGDPCSERGLEPRWVDETVDAVKEHAAAFRSSVTDAESFGPAKQIAAAMFADGVNFADEAAVERWISERNRT